MVGETEAIQQRLPLSGHTHVREKDTEVDWGGAVRYKFRVWTGKEMLNVVHGDDLQLNFGINEGWALWEPFGELCDHKTGELMQWSGVLDSEGKEIWEDDILEIYRNNGIDDRTDNFKVEFSRGTFAPECGMSLWEYEDDFKNGKGYMKVIGNIYEHPELLETK